MTKTLGWTCPECGRDVEVYYSSRHRSHDPRGVHPDVDIPAQHYIQCEDEYCGWWWPVNNNGRVCRAPDFNQFVLKQDRDGEG
jgi:hypothetical protein